MKSYILIEAIEYQLYWIPALLNAALLNTSPIEYSPIEYQPY